MRQKRTRKRDMFEPRKVHIKGQLFWQVNFPIEHKEVDGKHVRFQKRKTYKDRQEAETAAEQARIQVKNDGRRSFSLPDAVRRDAMAAVKELEPFGCSLLDAAKAYAQALRQQSASEKVSVALRAFLAAKAKDNLRPRYLKDLRVRLNRFSDSFGERSLASISSGEINAWLRGFQPFNRNTFRLRLSALFSYAAERGWCTSNPVAGIKKARASIVIGLLEPEQFARLLELADEQTLPYWLLGGFAGLRRAELERLEWKEVRFESGLIEVPVLKSKTASRRFVTIQPNLAAWLEPYRGRKGNVCPPNLRSLLEIDRFNAGIWKPTQVGIKALKAIGKEVDPATVKNLKPWPSNGLRHSFASYHLANFADAARLALELGHTDQKLLFQHYRELVTPEQAAKWWGIRPATQPNLVAIA